MTSDVVGLANFYKELLRVDNGSGDNIHQTVLCGETALTIYNDGKARTGNPNNIQLAFTVDDIDSEHLRLLSMGVKIVSPPAAGPWGATNIREPLINSPRHQTG